MDKKNDLLSNKKGSMMELTTSLVYNFVSKLCFVSHYAEVQGISSAVTIGSKGFRGSFGVGGGLGGLFGRTLLTVSERISNCSIQIPLSQRNFIGKFYKSPHLIYRKKHLQNSASK
jgi:hypothetical protein